MDFKKIKLVIWDLDETFWTGTLSEGNVSTPANNIALVKHLTDCGIINSICSKNNESEVLPELEKLGLQDYFVFKSINWEPKGQRVAALIKNMSLRPANVLFIDDNHQNLKEVEFYNEGIMVSFPTVIPELLDYVAQSDKKDIEHKRLKQYHVLQTKFMESQSYSDNETFLRSCGIHIQFFNDCLDNIERLHELILRTNQLNFTKQRVSLEEFEKQLKEDGVQSGYVKVHDRFGDYGVVGFYLLKENKLQHFLFSCRTIGQGVEQYVYAKLGYPLLEVAEPVATHLDKTSFPDWISEGEITTTEDSPSPNSGIKVLFKGPCDMQGMVGYLQMDSGIETEFTFTNDNGELIESHNHSAHIYGLAEWDVQTKERILSECFFMSPECYQSCIYEKGHTIIFLSTLIEGMYGLYRNKITGEIVAYGHYNYPVTDKNFWPKYLNKEVQTYGVKFSEADLASFEEKYEYIGRRKPEDYVKFLDYVLNKIDVNTHLCLILGTETPYLDNSDDSYADRHLYHKEFNAIVREYASTKSKLHLIEINDVVKGQGDFSNNINHYTPAVYYKLSKLVLSTISTVSDVDVKADVNRTRYFIKQYIQPIFLRIFPKRIYKALRDITSRIIK